MNPHATAFVPGGYAFDTTRKFVAKSATGVMVGFRLFTCFCMNLRTEYFF